MQSEDEHVSRGVGLAGKRRSSEHAATAGGESEQKVARSTSSRRVCWNWKEFEREAREVCDNVYLSEWIAVMREIEELGWMLPGGYMDVPANRNKELVDVLGSYIDNVVGSRRRMYAWSVPCEEALRSIAQASPNGVLELGAGTGYWASLLRSRGVPVACYDRVPVSGAVRFGEDRRRGEGGKTIPDAHVHTCSLNSVGGHAKINSQHALRSSICLQDFDCHFTATAAPFYKVHEGAAAAVDEFPGRTLMLCWPPKEQECSACEESGNEQDTESIFLALQVLCFLDEAADSQLVQALEKYKGDTLIYIGEWTGRTGGLKWLSPHGETAGPKFQAKVRERKGRFSCEL